MISLTARSPYCDARRIFASALRGIVLSTALLIADLTAQAEVVPATLAEPEATAPGGAQGRVSQQPQSIPELVITLLRAIETIGQYKIPSSFPRVWQVSRPQLEAEACGGLSCPRVKAVYVPDRGLYLDRTLDPRFSLIDRSILLHELVHHVQALTHRYAHLSPCQRFRAREQEAFAIQNSYLSQFSPAHYIPFSEALYRCEDED